MEGDGKKNSLYIGVTTLNPDSLELNKNLRDFLENSIVERILVEVYLTIYLHAYLYSSLPSILAP